MWNFWLLIGSNENLFSMVGISAKYITDKYRRINVTMGSFGECTSINGRSVSCRWIDWFVATNLLWNRRLRWWIDRFYFERAVRINRVTRVQTVRYVYSSFEISREAMAKITPSVSFFTVAIHVLVSFLLTYAYEIPGTSRVIVRINGTRCRVLYRSGIYFSSRESAGTPRQCIRSW